MSAQVSCRACGQLNPAAFRLCGMCGASLVSLAPECAVRGEEARARLEAALELYERKGYAVAAERTRVRLAATAPATEA